MREHTCVQVGAHTHTLRMNTKSQSLVQEAERASLAQEKLEKAESEKADKDAQKSVRETAKNRREAMEVRPHVF